MFVYYFSTSVSALSLLEMAYQVLVVCMYVCAGAISRVSFSDLFEPIAGVTNPII